MNNIGKFLMPSGGTDRRTFLKTTGAAASMLAFGGSAFAQTAPIKMVYDIGGYASTFWPLWVAAELGYFREANIDLSFILQPTQGVTLLMSGDAHYFGTTLDFVGAAIDKGADIVGLSTSLHSPTSFIGGKGIKTAADLKGKRLGVTVVGSADSVLIDLFMQAHGMKKGDYEVVAAGVGAEKIAAMTSGQIAGTTLTQPADYQLLLSNPDMTLLPDTHGTMAAGAHRFCTFTNKTWAAKNRPAVVAFLKAQLKASKWLENPANKAQAISILAAKTNFPAAAAEANYDAYQKAGIFAENIQMDYPKLNALLQAAEASGRVKFRPAAEYFDASYLKEAERA